MRYFVHRRFECMYVCIYLYNKEKIPAKNMYRYVFKFGLRLFLDCLFVVLSDVKNNKTKNITKNQTRAKINKQTRNFSKIKNGQISRKSDEKPASTTTIIVLLFYSDSTAQNNIYLIKRICPSVPNSIPIVNADRREQGKLPVQIPNTATGGCNERESLGNNTPITETRDDGEN